MAAFTVVSAGFMFLSSAISVLLLVLALRAHSLTRDASMRFLAAAFALFTAKSLLVGISLWVDLLDHEVLELVDAVGDLGTVLLIVLPLFRRA